jgi:hypothetical protein
MTLVPSTGLEPATLRRDRHEFTIILQSNRDELCRSHVHRLVHYLLVAHG